MNTTVMLISSVSVLLVISALTSWISKRTHLPFTVLLVMVGYGLSHLAKLGPDAVSVFASYRIDPHIILYVCLPTLIFESAFNMDAKLFKRNITPILLLAIPGLFISTAIIGVIVSIFTSLNFMVALLLGAILSATDPVAVIALFKQLGVPKRLTILVEGESLLNDSTAIVAAKTIIFIILAGALTSTTVLHSINDFVYEFFGGIFVGALMALVTGYMLKMGEDEPVIGLSLTIILAYLSFIVADKVCHVSGVMATITSGIVMAGWGKTKINAETESQLKELLEFLSYIANALIFLLVGLSMNLSIFMQSAYLIIVTIIAMLLSRAVVIYTLIPMLGFIPESEPINKRYQAIMWWGGLRGAIAVAIVLGLEQIPDQAVLETVVMGAVLFTILVQGLTIDKLIHWFKLDKPILFDQFSTLEAELMAEKVALDRIPELQKGGMFSLKIVQRLQESHQKSLAHFQDKIRELKTRHINENEERRILFMRCFLIEKNLYYDMFVKGHLSEQSFRNLNQEIEIEIDMMRAHSVVPQKAPISVMKRFIAWMIQTLGKVPLLGGITERMRISQTIHDYEEAWGLHQGCVTVLNYLHDLKKIESIHEAVLNTVKKQFQKWLAVTTKYLDDTAEQFPEFVNDMQRRLGSRLLLHAKLDTIQHEASQGLIPPGITQTILHKYEHRIKALAKEVPETLRLDPHELLARVPFFSQLPEAEIKTILSSLHETHIPANKEIIKEGDFDETVYFIMRGVVRVIKNVDNQEKEIATLIAGDFFGEISALYNIKRTATCRSVTPCLLYAIHKNEFAALMQRYPSMRDAIDKEAAKRQAE